METDQTTEAIETWLAAIDYPMYILTAVSHEEKSGCLVGFSTQCSIDPLRFLVCVSRENHTFGVAEHSEAVALHLVPATAFALAHLFGSESDDTIDKFEHCSWHPGPGGVPVLDDCPDWFAARVLGRRDVGDHVALLLEPVQAGFSGNAVQMGFQQARSIQAGHDA